MTTLAMSLLDLTPQEGSTDARIFLPAGRGDLARWFHGQGYTRGAEVGVWEGSYSEQLCRAIPGVHLTCVDPWQAYSAYKEVKSDQGRLDAAYQKTTQRLSSFGCTILRMTSLEAAAQIPDASLDFVFLDANHRAEFVQQDLAAWVPKVRSGGAVCGHDYTNHKNKPFIQVQPVVNEFVATRKILPLYVLAGDKSASFMWVVR